MLYKTSLSLTRLMVFIFLLSTLLTLIEVFYSKYWPAPPDDPQGIRVASVIEFSVCLSVCLFWANFLISLGVNLK